EDEGDSDHHAPADAREDEAEEEERRGFRRRRSESGSRGGSQMTRLRRHWRQGLGGSLLGIAGGILTLGLFVVAVLATPRVEASSRHSHDSYSNDDDDQYSERSGQSFHWDGRVGRGRTLEVRGINGGIEVEGTSGDQVVVDAEKRYR